jgi:hypothetical protein
MNLTVEQLAELLAGIVRSQQAIIDAVESESGGWRNTHLIPKLNTAANMRLANARLLDIPSRVLLRSQSRVPMDVETIARDLRAAMGAAPAASAAPVATPAASAAAASATAQAAAKTAPMAAVAAAAPAAAAGAAVGAAAGAAVAAPPPDDDLNFFET